MRKTTRPQAKGEGRHHMALFGKSKTDELMTRTYVLVANARARLLQADALRQYRSQVVARATWLKADELTEMEEALRKYAFSLISAVSREVGELLSVSSRPFLNMAIQPKEEMGMLSSTYGKAASQIARAVRDFDDTDSGVPSAAEVLSWLLPETKR